MNFRQGVEDPTSGTATSGQCIACPAATPAVDPLLGNQCVATCSNPRHGVDPVDLKCKECALPNGILPPAVLGGTGLCGSCPVSPGGLQEGVLPNGNCGACPLQQGVLPSGKCGFCAPGQGISGGRCVNCNFGECVDIFKLCRVPDLALGEGIRPDGNCGPCPPGLGINRNNGRKCEACPAGQGIRGNGRCGTCVAPNGINPANGRCGPCGLGNGVDKVTKRLFDAYYTWAPINMGTWGNVLAMF